MESGHKKSDKHLHEKKHSGISSSSSSSSSSSENSHKEQLDFTVTDSKTIYHSEEKISYPQESDTSFKSMIHERDKFRDLSIEQLQEITNLESNLNAVKRNYEQEQILRKDFSSKLSVALNDCFSHQKKIKELTIECDKHEESHKLSGHNYIDLFKEKERLQKQFDSKISELDGKVMSLMKEFDEVQRMKKDSEERANNEISNLQEDLTNSQNTAEWTEKELLRLREVEKEIQLNYEKQLESENSNHRKIELEERDELTLVTGQKDKLYLEYTKLQSRCNAIEARETNTITKFEDKIKGLNSTIDELVLKLSESERCFKSNQGLLEIAISTHANFQLEFEELKRTHSTTLDSYSKSEIKWKEIVSHQTKNHEEAKSSFKESMKKIQDQINVVIDEPQNIIKNYEHEIMNLEQEITKYIKKTITNTTNFGYSEISKANSEKLRFAISEIQRTETIPPSTVETIITVSETSEKTKTHHSKHKPSDDND